MSLENTFERIATALERIASSPNATVAPDVVPAAPAETVKAEPPDEVKSRRLARSAATEPTATTTRVNDKPAAANAAKVVSFEDMRNALVGVKTKLGPEISRAIMGKVGATNVTEIKPEDFGKVVAECARATA